MACTSTYIKYAYSLTNMELAVAVNVVSVTRIIQGCFRRKNVVSRETKGNLQELIACYLIL